MKTRSKSSNQRYERESDSDDSVFENRLRKKKCVKLSRRKRYGKSLRIGMQIRFSEDNHMPAVMGREHQTGEKLEKKHSPIMSVASHSSSSQPYINGEEAGGSEKNVRRSTRQRKFIYDNLNQTWLLAPGIPDFSKLESFLTVPERSPVDCEDGIVRRRSERNRNHEINRLGINSDSMEYDDMYSRVKRERRKSVHDYYSHGSPQGGSMADTEDTDQNGMSDSDSMGDASDIVRSMEPGVPPGVKGDVSNCNKYSLRPKKPITDRFQFPIETRRPRRSASSNLFEAAHRLHRRSRDPDAFKISTAHRSPLFRRKRHAIHNSSSSSSSDDERRFEKRKARSMARARNRCLPVNLIEEELTKGVLRDRMKIGCNLADIDPMTIDKSVTFDSIGGLDRHIQALKEMIVFPLMYPEVFEKFKIAAPRGVLFHGQPGTGKTLVARALANECSNNDRRIAFFMRKGADCLSKWVGESERQLRLLFEQAYSMRPSIIFFDEIDGLAPVRSTRQDQIHSSIVSTLLALMDGVDNRGEIVIIGATNRIDAIDPALRRPGRFDREMLFPLPSNEARQRILKIHMQKWNPPQPESVICELASRCVGYCGADLKAVCTEAALVALRRRYPQIYGSREKLQLDVSSIQVTSQDFARAVKKMKPSVQRTSVFSAKPIPEFLKPLLDSQLLDANRKLQAVFPISPASKQSSQSSGTGAKPSCSNFDVSSDESDTPALEEPKTPNGPTSERSRYLWPFVHRPRLLLAGERGQGQGTLAPALLHLLEHVPVFRIDIPSLFAVTIKTPEEACAQIFHEAQRNLPSILFLPHIGHWWETLTDTVRATFLSLLQDLEPCTPILLLATSDYPLRQLPDEVQDIFSLCESQVLHMRNPNEESRRKFFSRLMRETLVPPKEKKCRENLTEVLPVAPKPPIRQLTSEDLQKLRQKEEATMRELRLFLRDILNKLAKDRRFCVFARPVDPDEVPDYQDVIKSPMDLETMMTKIDLQKYETVAQFLSDINLVCQNALEYNPEQDPSGKLIRHRACALRDIAHALISTELDAEFEKICQDIHKSRKERGGNRQCAESTVSKPPSRTSGLLTTADVGAPPTNLGESCAGLRQITSPDACATRYSKRIRGIDSVTQSTARVDDAKIENFPVPNRTCRYTIWKRKKSPWFGSCRRKLIRRVVPKTTDGVPRKKFKACNKLLKSKAARSLSPIHETNNLIESSRPKRHSNSPMKEAKLASPTIIKSPVGVMTRERSSSLASPPAATVSPRVLSPATRLSSPRLMSPPSKLLSPPSKLLSPPSKLLSPPSKLLSPTSKLLSPELKVFSPNSRVVSPKRTLPKIKAEKSVPPNATSVCDDDNAVSCDIFIDSMCSKGNAKILNVSPVKETSETLKEKAKCGAGAFSPLASLSVAEPSSKSDASSISATKPVNIDQNFLQTIFDRIVKVTDKCNVERLQHLFSIIHHCIYRHRHEWDKHDLLLELQDEVRHFQQRSSS